MESIFTIFGRVFDDLDNAGVPIVVEEDGIRPHLAIGFHCGLDLLVEGLDHRVVRRQASELVLGALCAE